MQSAIEQIRHYHERTKHHLDGYAKGPEFLDWDQQPDPFRRFQGAEFLPLPLIGQQLPNAQLELSTLAALLELAMGLSAWKQFGPDRWALRCNPSSGNLHPTEAYVISTAISGLPDGVYHYAPHEHGLEKRAHLKSSTTSPQLLIGLSSIIWREAWKYGERSFRYVQLDCGHALAAFRYACAALGLNIRLLACPDQEITRLLGLDQGADFAGAEIEHADMLLSIQANIHSHEPTLPDTDQWRGHANALGGFPRHHWVITDAAAKASICHKTEKFSLSADAFSSTSDADTPSDGMALARLIKQRRSAQAFRGKTSIISETNFYQILNALLPGNAQTPWDLWQFPVRIHPIIFIHRIAGLEPGVYALPRRANIIAAMKAALSSEFQWQKPDSCPQHLPLYQLAPGDARKAARTLSCHQEIAASSAFSLAMLAEFDAGLSQGPHIYRHMHWEAGMLGQVLYLQAENIGMRGTGIGCFFDDAVHELLELNDSEFQTLYHFTVGDPKIDERLETLPPYSHLPDNRQSKN